ncbi:hypothetical protein [Sphingomonas sp.]|uniref:hypothetical protein n=1 Tax=Sphingomonas sp. TaxID=28214 RepID=UPI003AFF9B6C
MIALLLLQTTLGALPRQTLPPSGCAAFLWSRADTPQLVAMMRAEPAQLRVSLDGKPTDLPRVAAEGATAKGLAATSRYEGGGTVATLELNAVERPDLADGALVQEATLTVTRAGADTVVTALGGLVGCAPANGGR